MAGYRDARQDRAARAVPVPPAQPDSEARAEADFTLFLQSRHNDTVMLIVPSSRKFCRPSPAA